MLGAGYQLCGRALVNLKHISYNVSVFPANEITNYTQHLSLIDCGKKRVVKMHSQLLNAVQPANEITSDKYLCMKKYV